VPHRRSLAREGSRTRESERARESENASPDVAHGFDDTIHTPRAPRNTHTNATEERSVSGLAMRSGSATSKQAAAALQQRWRRADERARARESEAALTEGAAVPQALRKGQDPVRCRASPPVL